MALCYLDSSAVLKRYVAEVGSGWVTTLIERDSVAISVLTLAEVASGLARRRREGRLSIQQQQAGYREFLGDLPAYTVSALARVVVERAASLLLRGSAPTRLRTLDALHLASAELVFSGARERGLDVGQFVSADRALLEAARWVGLSTENPEDHP